MRLGDVVDPATGARIDRALAVVMPHPASLTGEDVAEIQCHGGQFVVRRIVALAVDAGARVAEPGEFTRALFLNGRIDLAEAELLPISSRRAAIPRSRTCVVANFPARFRRALCGIARAGHRIRAHLEVENRFLRRGHPAAVAARSCRRRFGAADRRRCGAADSSRAASHARRGARELSSASPTLASRAC